MEILGGGLKSQNFKRKVWCLTGISRRVRGKKLTWEGYGYFLEQHNLKSGIRVPISQPCWIVGSALKKKKKNDF